MQRYNAVFAWVCVAIAALAVHGLQQQGPSQCSSTCQTNDDCSASINDVCGLCIQVDSQGSHKCGQGCAGQCTSDAQCLATPCSVCAILPGKTVGQCATQKYATCGGACSSNDACVLNANCNQCIFGKCSAGCDATCATDRECASNANCPFCTNGTCSANRLRGCGEPCNSTAWCQNNKFCNLCIPQTTGASTCGAGCNKPCAADTDCGDSNCPACAILPGNTTGQCTKQKYATCGGACVSNEFCAVNAHCDQCISGKCSAGCGSVCAADAECAGNAICPYCTNGTCSSNKISGCGEPCNSTAWCAGNKFCKLCVMQSDGNGVCGAGCSGGCSGDSDCADSNCPFCNDNNTCVSSKCGAPCVGNFNCTSPQCQICEQGKCTSGSSEAPLLP